MHLELVIQMFGQKFFILQNIFFGVITQNWKNIGICYGVEAWRLNLDYGKITKIHNFSHPLSWNWNFGFQVLGF